MPRKKAEETAARYADFECSWRRSVPERMRRGFIRTFRPGLSDGPPMRSWTTLAEYRQWCEEHLEPWLGYCSPERVRQAIQAIEDSEAANAGTDGD